MPGSSCVSDDTNCSYLLPALQLFFAKVLRSATEDEVQALFSRFGKVYDVNLFRAFQGAPTTKVWCKSLDCSMNIMCCG